MDDYFYVNFLLTSNIGTDSRQIISVQISELSEQTHPQNQHPDQEKEHYCLILNFT